MGLVRALAAPVDDATGQACTLVAGKYFEQVRRRVLRALDGRAPTALADALAAARPAPDACWRPETGLAATACANGAPALAALQLIAMARPRALELAVDVGEGGRLYLDGTVVPVRGEVFVRADAERARLRAGDHAMQACGAGLWQPEATAAADGGRVQAFAPGPVRYVADSGRAGSLAIFPDPFAPASAGRRPDAASSLPALAQARAALVAQSPARRAWLAGTVDAVILVQGEAGAGLSSPDYPGLVALTAGRGALDYAEALACGAAHQALFQLALVAALTEPGAEEVHYVPSRRTYTTTRRALATAHEHVNAIAALEAVAAATGAPAAAQERVRRRRLMLATDCAPVLDASAILTDAGAVLWQRLRDVDAPAAPPRACVPIPDPAMAAP